MSYSEDKGQIIVSLSKNIADKGYNANKIINELVKKVNGGGGGSALLARAGCKDIVQLKEMASQIQSVIKDIM